MPVANTTHKTEWVTPIWDVVRLQCSPRTRPGATANPHTHPRRANISSCRMWHDRARARANDTRGSHGYAQRHSHACAARGEGICSRQELGHTPKPRRTRPCAAHKRARISTAGGAGGRRAQGEADGREKGCCGCRAWPGEGVRGAARLRGVRRVAARADLEEVQRLLEPTSRRGCRRPIVE